MNSGYMKWKQQQNELKQNDEYKLKANKKINNGHECTIAIQLICNQAVGREIKLITTLYQCRWKTEADIWIQFKSSG